MEHGKHEKTGGKKPAQKRQKKKRMTASMALVYVLFILGVSMLLSAVAIVAANDVFAFVKTDQDISVTIPEDASIHDVAKKLDEAGVVKYGTLFRFFTWLTDRDAEFVNGSHQLNSKMDYRAILNSLRKTAGSREVVSVVIPEGYTVEQIIQELVAKNVCEEEELRDTLANYDFDYSFLDDIELGEVNRLEGYLFPDTYEYYEGDEPVTVVNKMLQNFDSKFDQTMREQAEDLGYSIHEIVTIVSLIEKEAKLDDERAKIAGVIYNRLNSSDYPYLNIDASILYVVGHKEQLTQEDLEVDSPYNRYTHKGLPPGPIANPGYDSLYAALHPENHDYYFYVARDDGSHVFTETLDEHNAARESLGY